MTLKLIPCMHNIALSDSNSDVRIGKNPVQTVAIKLKQTTGTR